MSEVKKDEKKKDNKSEDKNRNLILNGEVTLKSTRELVESILEIEKYDNEQSLEDDNYIRKPINLIVNSNGGSVYDANNLIGVMKTVKTPVHTYCHGKAMSAGFVIFVAGDKRFTTNLATFMYHDMSVGIHGTMQELGENLKWYKTLAAIVNEFVFDMTEISIEELSEYNRTKEDWYFTAFEALKYGIADEIIPFKR